MIYRSQKGAIDLTKVTRLYPAGVIEMEGEVAEMSLEWIDLYGEKVKLLYYVLVFDFTQPGEEEKNRTVLQFDTKEALMQEMQKVATLYK